MSPNLLRAIFLVLIIVGVVYYFGSDNTVPNQGTLELEQSGNSQFTHADYVEQNNQALVQEVVKRTENPQVDDDLNALPTSQGEEVNENDHSNRGARKVHFSTASGCDGLNVVKHNKSVLPFPQYSNNYAPLNGHVSGYRSDGGSCANPQEIDAIPSRCDSGLACYPRDSVTAGELLPREDPYNMWSQVNPETPGHLADKNFLESGHHYGINTVGSSLRNPNLQLRADPPIPQIEVSPWLQSTIEPDSNRRAFEIGSVY